jgi:hypothetical protein
MELRPLAVTRIANMFPGVIVLAAGLIADVPFGVRAALVVAAMWLIYRGYHLGVVLSEEAILIRGLLWSRSIAIDRVLKTTLFPGVRWRSPSGRARWSPILAFAEASAVIPRVSRHNDSAMDIVENWIYRHRSHPGGDRA